MISKEEFLTLSTEAQTVNLANWLREHTTLPGEVIFDKITGRFSWSSTRPVIVYRDDLLRHYAAELIITLNVDHVVISSAALFDYEFDGLRIPEQKELTTVKSRSVDYETTEHLVNKIARAIYKVRAMFRKGKEGTTIRTGEYKKAIDRIEYALGILVHAKNSIDTTEKPRLDYSDENIIEMYIREGFRYQILRPEPDSPMMMGFLCELAATQDDIIETVTHFKAHGFNVVMFSCDVAVGRIRVRMDIETGYRPEFFDILKESRIYGRQMAHDLKKKCNN